jgi:hypothetical protein
MDLGGSRTRGGEIEYETMVVSLLQIDDVRFFERSNRLDGHIRKINYVECCASLSSECVPQRRDRSLKRPFFAGRDCGG